MDDKLKKCPANVFVNDNDEIVAHEAWSFEDGYRKLDFWFIWYDESIQPNRFSTTVKIATPPNGGTAIAKARKRRDSWLAKHGRTLPKRRTYGSRFNLETW